MGCFMYRYPKQILKIEQQVQSYADAGMEITSREDVEKVLKTIGFYRLRGYSFHKLNPFVCHRRKPTTFRWWEEPCESLAINPDL